MWVRGSHLDQRRNHFDLRTRVEFPSLLVLSSQGGSFGTLLVYDRDLTTIFPKEKSHNKYVGTLLSNDTWINDTFDIRGTYSEKKAAGGIRETIYDYRK